MQGIIKVKFCSISCSLILSISCLSISAPVLAQNIPEEAFELKEMGDKAIIRGDIEQAIYLYEKALQVYPDFPEVIYYLGLTYELDFDDLVNAIYYYKRYLEIAPSGEQNQEVALRLHNAEMRLAERKKESGIIEKEETPSLEGMRRRGIKKAGEADPPAPAHPTLPDKPIVVYPSAHTAVSDFKTDDVETIKIHEKLLRYDLKLQVWKREGFIDRFNELARMRLSTLEADIAGQREALRLERKKVTDFINYQDEAIKVLFKKAVLKGMANLGIELNHFPKGWQVEPFIHSSKIFELEEDTRFVDVSMEVAIDMASLTQVLISQGYIFEPNRTSIILQGVQSNLAEILIENITKESNYIGPSTGGLYPVYTSLQTFSKEIEQLKIGKYRFNPVSTGSNSITIQVLVNSG